MTQQNQPDAYGDAASANDSTAAVDGCLVGSVSHIGHGAPGVITGTSNA